ncbi:hypothetical protein [Pararhizobium polonicum]|uniref:hypothetical protein n=1 Tax=Pararhizobium polonicum TaxID=1612624 RepID=UPI003CC8D350
MFQEKEWRRSPESVEDMQDLTPVITHGIKDQIASMGAPSNANMRITRYQRKGMGRLHQPLATVDQLPDKGDRTTRIIVRDMICDMLDIRLGRVGKNDDHELPSFSPRSYLATRRASTSCPRFALLGMSFPFGQPTGNNNS